jgi:ABC-type nickel/cobalt efflux system permease component RcnA
MLFALANDMVFTGTVMVSAIAAGMAVTMSVLGLLGILARWLVLSRFEAAGQGRSVVGHALEYAGALAILTISSVLFIGSL